MPVADAPPRPVDTALVVGAGPTGLLLACHLLAAGVPVRVVDAAGGAATTSRALGLQPRGVEVLQRAGALGDLAERSTALGRVVLDLGGRAPVQLQLGRTTSLVTRPGLLLSQVEVEENLRRRLAELGASVEWGRELVAAEQDADGVSARFADGTALRCQWLLGCDGAHSRVRKAAGIGFPGARVVERFLLADVRADLPLPRDAVRVWLRGEEVLAAFPLPGADLWRLMGPADSGTAHGGPADGGPADGQDPQVVLGPLTARLAGCTGWPAALVRSAEWTSSFSIHRRLAQRYRQGRVLLAGDAAHVHSPMGGQGLNTGLGDAENLGWKLALVAHGRAAPALLDSYEAERRPVAAEVLESTSALTQVVVGGSALARAVRDRLLVPALGAGAVQRRVWERASQLAVTYRGGPLAGTARRSPSLRPRPHQPRPGDRVADLPCHRGDGAATRLHDELVGRWVLLLPPGCAPGTARASTDVARRRLGTDLLAVLTAADAERHDALLVRPDAHLAWRGTASAAALERWLSDALTTGRVRRGSRDLPG